MSDTRNGCPKCGAHATAQGQPSNRQFFACDSYLYSDNPDKLIDQTELCATREELAAVTKERDSANAKIAELIAPAAKGVLSRMAAANGDLDAMRENLKILDRVRTERDEWKRKFEALSHVHNP